MGALGETERERALVGARVAEQAERYEEMAAGMRAVAEAALGSGAELSGEERGLLSAAYKNLVGSRRSAWRVLAALARKEAEPEPKRRAAAQLRDKVETELSQGCRELLRLADGLLALPRPQPQPHPQPEAQVFFLKIKGDYLRYLCEVSEGPGRAKATEEAGKAYRAAQDLAPRLPTTNITRLGLALNHSVFLYEMAGERGAAVAMAREAFDAAVSDLERLDADTFLDASSTMKLLRDNVSLDRPARPPAPLPPRRPQPSRRQPLTHTISSFAHQHQTHPWKITNR